MYLDQHDHSAAISLFIESLQLDETLACSEQPLVSVCQAMDKTKDTHNLYRVVKLLVDNGISVCHNNVNTVNIIWRCVFGAESDSEVLDQTNIYLDYSNSVAIMNFTCPLFHTEGGMPWDSPTPSSGYPSH